MSGTVYVWDTTSGQLLRSWAAHYKRVTALAVLDDDSMFFSGGEDTLVKAWALADLLDITQNWAGGHRLEPRHMWSGHTLPITSITCGSGGSHSIILTTSMDRYCKIWSLASGTLVRSSSYPVGVTCSRLDVGEQVLYVGGADGRVFETDLIEVPFRGTSSSDNCATSLGGHACLEGHQGPVTCIALTWDGEMLVTGAEDGAVRVWGVRSRQCIRVLHTPGKVGVAGLLLVPRPAHLGRREGSGGRDSRAGPRRAQPLAVLAKFAGAPTTPLSSWEGAPVILDGALGCGPKTRISNLMTLGGQEEEQGGDSQQVLQTEVTRLKSQLTEERRAAEQWKNLHRDLVKFVTNDVLNAAGGP